MLSIRNGLEGTFQRQVFAHNQARWRDERKWAGREPKR